MQCAFIFEVGAQRIVGCGLSGDAIAVGGGPAASRGRQSIVHLNSHAHMVHQLRHRVHLDAAASRGQLCRHVAPIVYRGAEVGAQRPIGGMRIGVGAIARSGMIPVLHYLCCGSGHASRHGVCSTRVLGTHVVIIGGLVPRGAQQGQDRCILWSLAIAARKQFVPCAAYSVVP